MRYSEAIDKLKKTPRCSLEQFATEILGFELSWGQKLLIEEYEKLKGQQNNQQKRRKLLTNCKKKIADSG